MLITNTDFVPGKEIVEILGIARGSTVRARNVGRDIFASLKNIVGEAIEIVAMKIPYLSKCKKR